MHAADDPRFARWDRGLAALLLGAPAAVILAASVASNGATRIYTWPWAFYVQASLIAPWLWCGWSCARGRSGSPAAWRLVLPVLAALCLGVVASEHRHDAVEAALTLATPLVLLPFVVELWRRATAQSRIVAFRFAGAALALPALASLFLWLSDMPPDLGLRWLLLSRNPHPLGHWNYTGGLGLVTLPIALLLAWRECRAWRAAWSLVACLALVEIASSGSRGAVLGLLASTGMAAFLMVLRRGISPARLALGAAALGAAVMLASAVNPRLRQIVRHPASAMQVGESEQQRIGFLVTGYRIARAHPWFGVGPGTTPYHYPSHRADLPGSLENSFQLHCGPLQWGVDTGVIGLAALVFSVGAMKLRLWRARRTLSVEATAATTLLAGYGVLWLTDYQLDVPLFPIVLALAASVLLGETETDTSRDADPSAVNPRRACTVVACIVALGLAAVLAPAWRARAAFSAAWQAKDEKDAAGFVHHLRVAADTAPWLPYYHNHLAAALAGIARHMPPESAAAFREEAAAAWQESLRVSPAQDHPWLNLGWLALARGDTVEATHCLERAAAIYPRRTGLWFAMALARQRQSDTDGAARALAREIRVDPAFVISPHWNEAAGASARAEVTRLLAQGWPAAGSDPGAAPAPRLAAFARWWWAGTPDTGPRDPGGPIQPDRAHLLDAIDDPTDAHVESALGSALGGLRRSWRLREPVVADPAIPPELAAVWTAHLQAHPGGAFSVLLRTLPGVAARGVQRGADGILFRQADGDALADLTVIPTPLHARILAPLIPKAEVDEFMENRARQNAPGS